MISIHSKIIIEEKKIYNALETFTCGYVWAIKIKLSLSSLCAETNTYE